MQDLSFQGPDPRFLVSEPLQEVVQPDDPGKPEGALRVEPAQVVHRLGGADGLSRIPSWIHSGWELLERAKLF